MAKKNLSVSLMVLLVLGFNFAFGMEEQQVVQSTQTSQSLSDRVSTSAKNIQTKAGELSKAAQEKVGQAKTVMKDVGQKLGEAKAATTEFVGEAKAVAGELQSAYVEAKQTYEQVKETAKPVIEGIKAGADKIRRLLRKQTAILREYPIKNPDLMFGSEVVIVPVKWLKKGIAGQCVLLSTNEMNNEDKQIIMVPKSETDLKDKTKFSDQLKWILKNPLDLESTQIITSQTPVVIQHKVSGKCLAVYPGKKYKNRPVLMTFDPNNKNIQWQIISITKVSPKVIENSYQKWFKNPTLTFNPSPEVYNIKEEDNVVLVNLGQREKFKNFRFFRFPKKSPIRPRQPGDFAKLQRYPGDEEECLFLITLPSTSVKVQTETRPLPAIPDQPEMRPLISSPDQTVVSEEVTVSVSQSPIVQEEQAPQVPSRPVQLQQPVEQKPPQGLLQQIQQGKQLRPVEQQTVKPQENIKSSLEQSIIERRSQIVPTIEEEEEWEEE
ncbi:hypothetical protein ACFLYH_03075 [Candidatus Dependentiae bacterium]